MLNYVEPLIIVAAFWVAWDYRQPAPLLPLRRSAPLAPVTLEEQRTAEWLASIRPPVLAPHAGGRGKPGGYLARRKAATEYTPRHYTRS